MLKSRKETADVQNVICFDKCIAKTNNLDGTVLPGIGVFEHCVFTGLIAKEIIDNMPEGLSKALFPSGTELLVSFHDIGKVSPGFQCKIWYAIDPKNKFGLGDPSFDSEIGGHAAVSCAAINKIGKYYGEVVGRHHGFSPKAVGLPNDEIYGGCKWQIERDNLVEKLKSFFKIEPPKIDNEYQADAISGLTCMADWISSGYPFKNDDINSPNLKQIISELVKSIGYSHPELIHGLGFSQLFPDCPDPYPAQISLINTVTEPGVYIFEAPMGMGKTEAALYAAYRMVESGKANGIYFALPTRLTSDSIYSRMKPYLDRIIPKSCKNRRLFLLHGTSKISESKLGGEGEPGKSWFDHSKCGILSPFAVGTIDQALMSVMNVKFGHVRFLGLAGKVVILDEVHTYDSYTGTIIKRLVDVLKKLGCIVIILSATLTSKRRAELLGVDEKIVSSAYPLISSVKQSGKLEEYPTDGKKDIKVNLDLFCKEEYVLSIAIERAKNGEQILWIENTVNDAQRIYRLLKSRVLDTVECGLVHSRFTKKHRTENEKKWVDLYGKKGGELRDRNGRILVGTQVLEQSLDIDSDLLITRFCPIDMILQRIGRLWRHSFLNRKTSFPQVFVLAPTFNYAIENKESLGKTGKIYAPYVLFRTLEVLWRYNKHIINVPSDIRKLLEAVYEDRIESGTLGYFKEALEENKEKLSRLALLGISRGGTTIPENKAFTRHGDVETVETLLIKSIENIPTGNEGKRIYLLDDSYIDLLSSETKIKKDKKWREIASTLIQNTISVLEYIAPKCSTNKVEWLRNYAWIGENEESAMRVALLDSNGDIMSIDGSMASEKYNLSYDTEYGYIATK